MNQRDSTLATGDVRRNQPRQDFWNGTLLDDYNFLMSEELICQCKSSLGEPFISLNDLAVHHVSYNEFEKQFVEFSEWCEKISSVIKQISSNALTCYLRQRNYEELYEQGAMRLRTFNQYANKLIERFADLRFVIEKKMEMICQIWNELEARFIGYLDEDFEQIIRDLHTELYLLEEWVTDIDEHLARFNPNRHETILFDDMDTLTKLQDEIKSKNSRVSSLIEICQRLRKDYPQQAEQIPTDDVNDLETRWHQIWINAVEVQCKLEERLKKSTSLCSIDDNDDIIPFNSSDYEKISVSSSTDSSIDQLPTPTSSRKRPRSTMAKSHHRLSLTVLPTLSPSTFYYSLTNVHDYDDESGMRKRQKKTSSKLDIGYASGDDFDRRSFLLAKKSYSDYALHAKPSSKIASAATHSLPTFDHDESLPEWWRHSTTSAYDTSSNPEIDLSVDDKATAVVAPSLLMYSKKYTRLEQKSPAPSNSYDASGEYTDADQSENDVDALSSSSPTHQQQQRTSETLFYNRYTTTTTGYSSELDTATSSPSAGEKQHSDYLGDLSAMHVDQSTVASNASESLTTVTTNEKLDASEPCWDGYQSPLFYPLHPQDVDSIESTLKWDDQFFEMDQSYRSSSDDDRSQLLARTNNGMSSSSSLLLARLSTTQQFDSDSDLDDFNYVVHETERQLNKARLTLDKKTRRQQLTAPANERHQRKFDEIHRTCDTNILCLQQVLSSLRRSTNARLNNSEAVELLETYLTDWYAMRRQVNDNRSCARHLLQLSQELIKLRDRFDEQIAPMNTTFNPSWFANQSFDELKERIYYEIELDKENRQKVDVFYADVHQLEEHAKNYRLTFADGPASLPIDEQLHGLHLALDQLTNKMDSYQIQLRALSSMINNLLPIEYHIEQKLTAIDYPTELHELQTLVDNYARMIPMNDFYAIVKHHCEYKLDAYRKMLHEFMRKHEKHVSFDSASNCNNNNSTNINSSSASSSASSTPQQPYVNEYSRHKKAVSNKYRQKDTRDSHRSCAANDSSSKQSSTSSYISDDCKVLYIETVIEVAKPIYYERTTDTVTSSNTEYHHQHIPTRTASNRSKYVMDTANHQHDQGDSTDDDASSKPVNMPPATVIRRHLNRNYGKQNIDSGVELDQTSSSSTICNQRATPKEELLFPPAGTDLDETSQSSLLRHIRKRTEQQVRPVVEDWNEPDSSRGRPSRSWFRSLFVGLLMLLLLFIVYLSGLDRCSRACIIRAVYRHVISIESDGLPTI